MSTPRYITLDEAAERYGVTTRTIRRRIADGTVAGYQLRGSDKVIRLKLDDVENLFERMPTDAGA